MSIHLTDAAAILSLAALGLLVIPAQGKWKRPTCWIVGGALILLAALLAWQHFTASA
jgi:type IV secretory pathway VirB2 component (pilin)